MPSLVVTQRVIFVVLEKKGIGIPWERSCCATKHTAIRQHCATFTSNKCCLWKIYMFTIYNKQRKVVLIWLGMFWMFCQKRQSNESLPQTSDSLQHQINRSNYQALVWKRAHVAKQQLPAPNGNGWIIKDGLRSSTKGTFSTDFLQLQEVGMPQ